MHEPAMQAAVDACAKAGIGLVAMKTQGMGPATTPTEAELKVAEQFLDRGFTDKQAKLKGVWENRTIASICSQMPSITILSANVAAARDQTSLSTAERGVLRERPGRGHGLLRRLRQHLPAGHRRAARERCHAQPDVPPNTRSPTWPATPSPSCPTVRQSRPR